MGCGHIAAIKCIQHSCRVTVLIGDPGKSDPGCGVKWPIRKGLSGREGGRIKIRGRGRGCRQGWRTVNHINRRLNREIRHVDDLDLHGEQDRWTLPVGSRGDCEDFVLAKRAALLDAGVPAEALSIAIVETRWGETHAVLLLASDRGEFVLDSLSPWVSRWDRVDYRWRERQARGGAFDWVNVAL